MNGLRERNEAAEGGQSLFLGHGVSEADHRFKKTKGVGRVGSDSELMGGAEAAFSFLYCSLFPWLFSRPFLSRGQLCPPYLHCLDDGEPPGRVKKESKRRKEEGGKEHFAPMLPFYLIHSTVMYFFQEASRSRGAFISLTQK